VVFYVHLAYTFDLQAFFGPHAWLDLQIMNEFRTDAPITAPPSDWEEVADRPPSTPEEEAFVQKWGVNPNQVLSQGRYVASIWYHVTDPTWARVVHGCVLAIMLSSPSASVRALPACLPG
jgi:hypothetical protein